MNINKLYIDPISFRKDSFLLGQKIIKDKFNPTFMVALWRGGASIGMYIHEQLKWNKINCDHIAIRTSRYTGIDTSNEEVIIHNLTYITERLKEGDSILLVDDVWDTGKTIEALIKRLEKEIPFYKTLDVRVATIYFKPTKNVTNFKPNYFIHDTDKWLVFPHELEGMSIEEIRDVMGDEISNILMDK